MDSPGQLQLEYWHHCFDHGCWFLLGSVSRGEDALRINGWGLRSGLKCCFFIGETVPCFKLILFKRFFKRLYENED